MSSTQNARTKFTIAEAQKNLYSVNLASVVGKVDTEKMGTVYNPFTSKPSVTDAVNPGASYSVNTATVDADTIQVNRRAIASEHIDSFDQESLDFDLMGERGENYGKVISNTADGHFFNQPVVSAGVSTLDDGNFGGTSGNSLTISNTNMDDVINESLSQVHFANSFESRKFMAVSPFEASSLRAYLQSTGNAVADEILVNGFNSSAAGAQIIGTTFSGIDVYAVNNLTNKVVLGLATNPTDGDTITILGVTITFVATLSGSAGEVHIAGTVDTTAANLAEFINDYGETSEAEATNTGYTALSESDSATFRRANLQATADATADEVLFTAYTTLRSSSVSETLTAAADTFGTPYRFLVFGDYGSINLYLPSRGMQYEEKAVTSKAGRELMMLQYHNSVIWSRMKDRVLSIQVN